MPCSYLGCYNLIKHSFHLRILSLGPTFNVDVEGIATLDTDITMSVDLAYNISHGELFFPPGQNKSTGNFAPAQPSMSPVLKSRPIADLYWRPQAFRQSQCSFTGFFGGTCDTYGQLATSPLLKLSYILLDLVWIERTRWPG